MSGNLKSQVTITFDGSQAPEHFERLIKAEMERLTQPHGYVKLESEEETAWSISWRLLLAASIGGGLVTIGLLALIALVVGAVT